MHSKTPDDLIVEAGSALSRFRGTDLNYNTMLQSKQQQTLEQVQL